MTTKERPILFSCDMVRAILDGRKTQTRRPIKPQPPSYIDGLHGNKLRQRAPYRLEHPETGAIIGSGFFDDDDRAYKCPFGVPGDVLWVRETFARYHTVNSVVYGDGRAFDEVSDGMIGYRADGFETVAELRQHVKLMGGSSCVDVETDGDSWRPSIHMPRWASRITLEVVSVRAQRVQEITEEDAQAEGVDWPAPWSGVGGKTHPTCIDAFFEVWKSIYGRESLEANEWVWAGEFRRVNS